jgi:hypothetical protein
MSIGALLECFNRCTILQEQKLASDSPNDSLPATDAGQEVELQQGCREVLLRAAKEGVATHVVSVNWSSTLLRAALAAPAEPQPPLPPGSRQQEAVSLGGAVSRDLQDNGATEPATGPQDKEAPVPETAAAYQVLLKYTTTAAHRSHTACSQMQHILVDVCTVVSTAASGAWRAHGRHSVLSGTMSRWCAGVDVVLPASCRRELKACSAAAAARRSAARLPTSPTVYRSGESCTFQGLGVQRRLQVPLAALPGQHTQEGRVGDDILCRAPVG